MKKIIRFGLALILLCILATSSFAAETGTFTITPSFVNVLGQKARIYLTIVWAANSSHAFSDRTINAITYGIQGYYLVSSETISGTPAPTDGYVVTIKTANGSSLFSMTGSNSTTVGVLTNYTKVDPVSGNLTFSVSGNSINSSTATCILKFDSN